MMIRVEEGTFHMQDQGSGEALVALHGFTGASSTWDSLTERLRENFRIISIDLPGHGGTIMNHPHDAWSIEETAECIVKVLEEAGIDQFNLLGYSMGGRLALSIAVLYPGKVLSLLLESASPGLKTVHERKERVEKDEDLARSILQEGVPSFVRFWEDIPLFQSQHELPEEKRKALRVQRLSNSPEGLAGSLRGMGTGTQPSYWEKLRDLSMPVLLMAGERDRKFHLIAQEMQQMIPKASLYIFEGAGHAIHVENENKFGTMVKKFLETDKINEGGF